MIKNVDPIIIEEFKQEIIESLSKIKNSDSWYQSETGLPDQKTDTISNVRFEYSTNGTLLVAKSIGCTYVEIEQKSLTEVNLHSYKQ